MRNIMMDNWSNNMHWNFSMVDMWSFYMMHWHVVMNHYWCGNMNRSISVHNRYFGVMNDWSAMMDGGSSVMNWGRYLSQG